MSSISLPLSPPASEPIRPSSPCPFDKLPTELLQLIFESFGTSYHQEFGFEIQKHLLSLCLVSKRFLALAQPLLFQFIDIVDWWLSKKIRRKIRTNGDLPGALEMSEEEEGLQRRSQLEVEARQEAQRIEARRLELASGVRYLDCYPSDVRKDSRVVDRLIPVIRALALNAKGPFEALINISWCPISLFDGSTLRKMFLIYGAIEAGDTVSWVLPQLEEAFLHKCRLPPGGILRDQLPSLRHLAWSGYGENVDPELLETIETFRLQLDSLGFHIQDVPTLLTHFSDFPFSKSLIDTWIQPDQLQLCRLHQSSICHLRLLFDHSGPDWLGDEPIPDFSPLISQIESGPSPSPLRSVYVVGDTLEEHEAILRAHFDLKDRLVGMCKRKGIEVVEEWQPTCGLDGDVMSPTFVRRMTKWR